MYHSLLTHGALCALLLMCAACGSTGPASPGASVEAQRQSLRARVDGAVQVRMAADGTPGVALAVVHAGEPIILKGYGFANVEHGAPVTPSTVFMLGSLGKQFFAALVLSLVEDRQLTLDDPIRHVLPEAPASWAAITWRHLLTHTSGLGDYLPETLDYKREFTDDELLALAYKLPIRWAPGERFSYSNAGYAVMGIAIGKLMGIFYGDLLVQRIFTPLGMRSARVNSQEALIPNRAASYQGKGDDLRNMAWASRTLNRSADGSLCMSLLDFIAWDSAVRGRKLLKGSSWHELLTPVTLNSGRRFPYGFGWDVDTVDADVYFQHGGSWQGFEAHYGRLVRADEAVIVLTNSDNANATQLLIEVAAAGALRTSERVGEVIDTPVADIVLRLARLLDDASQGKLSPDEFAYARVGFAPFKTDALKSKLKTAGVRESVRVTRAERLGDDLVYVGQANYTAATLAVRLTVAPDGKLVDLDLRQQQ